MQKVCSYKLKPEDNFPNSTKSLQIIDNNMMRVIIKPGKSNIRKWGTEKLCQELKLLIINQVIIKSKLLETGKAFHIESYPLCELVTESFNKYISKSNLITRSNMNNTLRPKPGNKLSTNSLFETRYFFCGINRTSTDCPRIFVLFEKNKWVDMYTSP